MRSRFNWYGGPGIKERRDYHYRRGIDTSLTSDIIVIEL